MKKLVPVLIGCAAFGIQAEENLQPQLSNYQACIEQAADAGKTKNEVLKSCEELLNVIIKAASAESRTDVRSEVTQATNKYFNGRAR